MSEEELEILITLDDPGNGPEEDTLNHLQINNLEYWLGQRSTAWCDLDKAIEDDSNITRLKQ